MNKQQLLSKIRQVRNEVSRLDFTVGAMSDADFENHPDNYASLSEDAALLSEQIACKLRHLIYSTTKVKKDEYLVSAASVQGIQIHSENGILEITLPCLLPKRKQRRSTEFITDPLYFALSQYADGHALPKYRQCVVCFSHIYSRDLFGIRARDYDNLELKALLDVIASFLMEDDGGLLCDAYNTTELGQYDCTRISVMDKNRFYDWIKERETRLKSISDF